MRTANGCAYAVANFKPGLDESLRRPPGPHEPPPLADYPRAGMMGSTDPKRTDSYELQLDPGRYSFAFIGTLGYSNCKFSTTLDLEP
jgi:hypothetical protein